MVLLAALFALAGAAEAETEPNNGPGAANTILPGSSMTGEVNTTGDLIDYFTFTAVRGDLVRMRVDPVTTAAPVRTVSTSIEGNLIDWEKKGYAFEASWLFSAPGTVVFRVQADTGPSKYAVSSELTATGFYDDEGPTLHDLASDPRIEFFVRPRINPGALYIPGAPLYETQGINMQSGDGYLFGQTLCVETTLAGGIQGLVFHAGDEFRPSVTDLQKLVASRTGPIDVPAGGAGCFNAMARDTNGYVGTMDDRYTASGSLTGAALAVMKEIDARKADGAIGVLALWAITVEITESHAYRWGATSGQINGARAILTAAGQKTPLNADNSWVMPVGVAGVLGVIAVALVVLVRRDRQQKRAAEANAPAAGAAVAGAPSAQRSGGVAGVASSFGGTTSLSGDGPYAPAAATAPCTRCGVALAIGTPKCKKCGMPQIWPR